MNIQRYSKKEYTIVPIRDQDQLLIMRWRNEQMYHLRQTEFLTEEKQALYFKDVVAGLFEEDYPNQLLFSFMKNEQCIGYGGLVHIDWIEKEGELSFIMNTALELNYFEEIWTAFLKLIEKPIFEELRFQQIKTYAYDLRPKLYEVLEKNGYFRYKTLVEEVLIKDERVNVVIHKKINPRVFNDE